MGPALVASLSGGCSEKAGGPDPRTAQHQRSLQGQATLKVESVVWGQVALENQMWEWCLRAAPGRCVP